MCGSFLPVSLLAGTRCSSGPARHGGEGASRSWRPAHKGRSVAVPRGCSLAKAVFPRWLVVSGMLEAAAPDLLRASTSSVPAWGFACITQCPEMVERRDYPGAVVSLQRAEGILEC